MNVVILVFIRIGSASSKILPSYTIDLSQVYIEFVWLVKFNFWIEQLTVRPPYLFFLHYVTIGGTWIIISRTARIQI